MQRAKRLRNLADKLHEPNRRHIGELDHKLMMDAARDLEYLTGRLNEIRDAMELLDEFRAEGK